MNRLFVDNLTVIDFAFLDANRGLVGESWIVDVELAGELDEQGMVFDFGHVKRSIKQVIDERVDHCLVVPMQSPSLQAFRSENSTEVRWQMCDGGQIYHRSPLTGMLPLPAASLSKAAVAAFLQTELLKILPNNVLAVILTLREEAIDGPYYHYVHGLKKHLGNCQRIAHGHRSRIEIFRDGAASTALSTEWAQRWQDIYIGTEEDLTAVTHINNEPHAHFAYESTQGEYELRLPSRCVYLIDTDSTVEWIANHIASACQQAHPASSIKVKAFEGVGKGAIAER